jgi:hypothetical protein
MVLPIDPNQEYTFIATVDKELEPDQQSRFVVRPLTAREEAYVTDSFLNIDLGGGEASATARTGERVMAILNMGLIRWENFPPGAGTDLRFAVKGEGNKRRISDATLSRIPSEVRMEIANAITEGLGLTEDDEKNSESQSGDSAEA